MKTNSTFKDMVHVTLGNLISLISSILNGFVIPMVLGTLNYGYYKIFILYASYESLTHFGFNDGIMLSFAGKKYDSLNKYVFRSNTVFFFWFQLIVSFLICLPFFFSSNSFYRILFLFLGINNFVINVRSYYQNISQIVMRFDEYSIINALQYSCIIIAVLSILWYCKEFSISNISFIPYVCIVISINALLDLWYFYDYRKITFGPHISLNRRIKKFIKYFITGAFVTLGYGISVLIFNLDSQFVVKFFSTRTYGIYAFAYSMFSTGLNILLAAGPVLLPHLKRHSKNYILNRYSNNISCILILVYLAISGYFFLNIILRKFLFKYYNSLIYFRLLLPSMAVICCMTLIISNYYYALKKVKFYFYLNLFVLLISFIMDLTFYLIFKSPVELALSSTLSALFWYFISNYFLIKWYSIKWKRNTIYIILMVLLFLVISFYCDSIIGFVIYCILCIMISLLLFRKLIIQIIKRMLNLIFK